MGIFMSIKNFLKKNNWKENPFSIVPVRKPSILVGLDEELQRTAAAIEFGGDTVIEGPYGAGKTSLLRCTETTLSDKAKPIYFPRPPKNEKELIWKIKTKLELDNDFEFYELYNIISDSPDDKIVLLVDEAQKLETDIAQFLQDLSDLENVVLVYAALDGFYIQRLPEIHKTLYDRVVEVITLELLTKEEIREMIKKRIEAAGGKDISPFTEKAIDLIAEHSQGAPREALKICSSAIIKAITTGRETIDEKIVDEVLSRKPSEVLNRIKSLGRREKEVMRIFISKSSITNRDIQAELKISSQAAYNILARLMEKELIEARETADSKKSKEYIPKEIVKRILTPEIAEQILTS